MERKELKIQIYDSIEEVRPHRWFPVTDGESIFDIFSSGIMADWDILAHLRTAELVVASEYKNDVDIAEDTE